MEEKSLALFDGKTAARKLFDNWAYILLVLVLLMSILSGYTDLGFNFQTTVNIGMDYAVLLIFCYTARYSFDNIAKNKGALSEKYIAALDRLEKVRARVKQHSGEELQSFCDYYRKNELECTRRQIVEEAMLDVKDFEDYVAGKAIPKGIKLAQKRALRRAKRCKPIHLNRFMIGRPVLSLKARQSFLTPEQDLKKKSLPTILTTALTVLFPVSLSLSVILAPSLATLFEALLKTLTVLIAGTKGYSVRLRNMTETVPTYVEQQEDFLDAFETWRAEKVVRDDV